MYRMKMMLAAAMTIVLMYTLCGAAFGEESGRRLLEYVQYNGADEPIFRTVQVYDDNGILSGSIVYDLYGEIVSSSECVFEYVNGNDGYIASGISYDENGEITGSFEEVYEYGNMVSKIYYDEEGEIYLHLELAYDDNGNVLSQISYNSDGSISQRRDITYDANGDLWMRSEYAYEEDGNMSVMSYGADDVMHTRIVYIYEDE